VMPAEAVWVPKKRTPEETLAFAGELLTTLEGAAWEAEAIETAMKKLGEAKGWSVKENFMLLRAIITGSVQSPPLWASLIVFVKARSIDRVRRFIEAQKKTRR
jgi:glutamyl-tRNA synthetase